MKTPESTPWTWRQLAAHLREVVARADADWPDVHAPTARADALKRADLYDSYANGALPYPRNPLKYDPECYPLSTFPCTLVRVGDLVIPVRPWPTPDPAKCQDDDTVGILFGPEDPSAGSPLPFHRCLLTPPVWATAVDLDLDNVEESDIQAIGWVWLSPPRPLDWTAGTQDDTPAGRPCWRAEPAPGLSVTIVEFVVTRGMTSHAEWAVHCHETTPPTEIKVFEEFLDLDEARRVAASWVRDRMTRRRTP